MIAGLTMQQAGSGIDGYKRGILDLDFPTQMLVAFYLSQQNAKEKLIGPSAFIYIRHSHYRTKCFSNIRWVGSK